MDYNDLSKYMKILGVGESTDFSQNCSPECTTLTECHLERTPKALTHKIGALRKRAKDIEGAIAGVETPKSIPKKRKAGVKIETEGDDDVVETPSKKPRARAAPKKKAEGQTEVKAEIKAEHTSGSEEDSLVLDK